MPFKLTKQELIDRDQHHENLLNARATLEDAVTVANRDIAATLEILNKVVSDYNELANAAAGWCDDIARERSDEWEEKSERWQEGDKGTEAQEWHQAYEQHGIEEVDAFEVDELEVSVDDAADILSNLSEAAGE